MNDKNAPSDFAAYRRSSMRCLRLYAVLLLACLSLALFSLLNGAMPLTVNEIIAIIRCNLAGEQAAGVSAGAVAVVWQIRLPRIICSLLAGGSLAFCGTIFQAVLQNPLADPYTLGVSTGAAFGACIAILFNITLGLLLPVTGTAMLFSLVTLLAVLLVAKGSREFSASSLIISGIIISSFLSAGISFIKMLAGEDVSAIVYWLMGSLSGKSWRDAALLAAFAGLTAVPALLLANDLDIIAAGGQQAELLGVNAKALRLFYLCAASLLSAACVSVCGVIGFVGLIVPHLLRFWITGRHRWLLPLSALFGAALLLLADTAARLIGQGEIPVGVLTTLLGGPFFIFIFLNRKGGGV